MIDFNKAYQFLEKDLQNEILQVGILKTIKQGNFLVREGQFITGFPLILSGMIRVTRTNKEGNELLLYYLEKNEVCAMSLTCCMTNLKSSVKAIAEEDTEIIMLPVAMLDNWMCKYPTWKQFIMETFQIRFRELIETIDTIAFLKLDQRLINYFSYRKKKSGLTTFKGTHQDLALQINTSREVVSRLLKKLEKQGKVKLSRNFIDFSNLL
ncbi:MAG: Crp/Fnr family transcriptional regulator [Prolixibacteraceae bacterium]|nr:Crp/Fnr family transcriptional regulator [Prolixibacteraceae bacterium]